MPLIFSNHGVVHRDAVERWKDFAQYIKVDSVWMAHNMLSTTSSLSGGFSIRAAGPPRLGEKNHPEEWEEEAEGPPERNESFEERRELLGLGHDRLSAVCVRSSGTPPPTQRPVDIYCEGRPEFSK